jgi:quercetin dioxygenase-like cupin family protein
MRSDPNLRRAIPLLLALATSATDCASRGRPEDARVVLSQAMPALDSAHLQVTIVEVTYTSGGGSAPHSHHCPGFGSVFEGTVRSGIRASPVEIYRTGQSFYEASDAVHEISTNASGRKRGRFLALFGCDRSGLRIVPASDRVSGGLR